MARVAVIGAGFSGLVSIKTCLEEGLVPSCFEMSEGVGGMWRYHETPEPGRGCVMSSTVLNSSKELSGASDFPFPADFPVFPDHKKVLKYLEMYADEFGLRSYIRFNRKVVRVLPKPGQRWSVTTRATSKEDPEEETAEFDAVIVCNGHHSVPLYPATPGLWDKFKEKILHSGEYRHPKGLEGKRVLVVGCGDSGADIATELSQRCPQVYVSVRNGAWILPRVGPFGFPFDVFYLNRLLNYLYNLLPYHLWSSIVEGILNFYFNHKRFRMKPSHRIFDQTPTSSALLPTQILSGKIIIKGDVSEYTEKGVIFQGDTEETPIDVAIFATGYKMEFPFLPENIVVAPDNINSLYKFVFPPDHPTLAFVGLFQSIGPSMPPRELQSRWVAAVLSGRCKLPPESEMRAVVKEDLRARAKRFGTKPSHANHFDLINTTDELAEYIGVKPSLGKMLFRDPRLFFTCLVGPCMGTQFRLQGPHAWPKAREVILGTFHRMSVPLNTRSLPQQSSSFSWMLGFVTFVIVFLVILGAIVIFKYYE